MFGVSLARIECQNPIACDSSSGSSSTPFPINVTKPTSKSYYSRTSVISPTLPMTKNNSIPQQVFVKKPDTKTINCGATTLAAQTQSMQCNLTKERDEKLSNGNYDFAEFILKNLR